MDLGFYTSYKMLVGVFGWEGKAHIKNRVECPRQINITFSYSLLYIGMPLSGFFCDKSLLLCFNPFIYTSKKAIGIAADGL